MPATVGKFIRVQNMSGRDRKSAVWRTVPNCEKLALWDSGTAEVADASDAASAKRHIFHVSFVQGIGRGSRVTYLGQHFQVLEVSDSTKLLGLELRCAPMAG